jgi:hypothetical protein
MRVAGGTVFYALAGMLAAAGVGCKKPLNLTAEPANSTIARSLTPMVPAEGLLVQSVMIEQPVGDAFLDCELWRAARPVGEPETRALLAENGLRAGILSGTLPQRFQDLIHSDADTVSPSEMSFNTRKEAVIPTAGPVDPCRFELLTDLAGQKRPIEFRGARCGVLVRPRAEGGGRVIVYCEPQIQHGERRDRYRPNEDGTGFVKTEEMPLERFSKVGFDAVLGAGDCLVIGWNAEQTDSLGQALFAVEINNRPRQRVLVIRAYQNGRSSLDDLPVIPGPFRQRR